MKSSSRSVTPEADSIRQAEYAPAFDFLASISRAGYPKDTSPKVQPWQGKWEGPQKPKNGTSVVACAKDCIFGMPIQLQREYKQELIWIQEATIWAHADSKPGDHWEG